MRLSGFDGLIGATDSIKEFFGGLEMPSIATWIRECDEHWFALIFNRYPDLTVHNARTHRIDAGQMDALLLTGGGDISASFLRQPIAQPSLIVDSDCRRDEWEFKAVGEMLAAGKPILAICRGLQVLNVALGGTLQIDIPDHDNLETSNVQPLRHSTKAVHRFAAVNSSHHQALEKLADGIEVEAWSASDEIIEQARLCSHAFAVGVQYHPERHALYLPLFADFFDRVRNAG
jgi:putative glutamine amidotransferase